jgi:multiple sugar transport system permease protein
MNWIKIGGSHYPGPLFPLILPYVAFNLPLGVFLLRSFFAEIPDELILAAKVDGATNFQIFRKILLPLTRPGIFTTAMMVFIFAWNELLFARMFLIQSDQFYTVPLSILQFQKSSSELTGIPWVPELVLNAASIIATLPLIIMVLILQKNIIKGITAGAVKG